MGRVVGREANCDPVAGNHSNSEAAHSARELSRNLLSVLEGDLISATAENLVDTTGRLYQVVSRQIESVLPTLRSGADRSVAGRSRPSPSRRPKSHRVLGSAQASTRARGRRIGPRATKRLAISPFESLNPNNESTKRAIDLAIPFDTPKAGDPASLGAPRRGGGARSNAPDSKSGVPLRVPWVRIPPSPPLSLVV